MSVTIQLDSDIQQDVERVNQISAVTDILDAVCRMTGMGFAVVARVTEEKWVACAVKDDINFGLRSGGELELKTTICHEIHQRVAPVVIDHVENDSEFCGHHTPAMYGFQSYISVPIVLKNGDFFGTLCAIDPRPANLKESGMLEIFNLFADLISFHITASRQLESTQSALTEQMKVSELREQFIAVLGHDLRNPVNAIASSAQIIQSMPLDSTAQKLVSIIRSSSVRINGLIENLMDFARGRLGGGIKANLTFDVAIEDVIRGVVAELQVVNPDAHIETQSDLRSTVPYDSKQISQLLSNLLANAITHRKRDTPVAVSAKSMEGLFMLSVCNEGEELSRQTRESMFKPFYRGDHKGEKTGLGLGLYIASEIARAHGGNLDVSSENGKICFLLTIPLLA